MKLTLKTQITELICTADDWELFTDRTGVSNVAHRLNWEIVTAVNEGCSREETRKRVGAIMDQNDAYGASDSEPRRRLEEILSRVFLPNSKED